VQELATQDTKENIHMLQNKNEFSWHATRGAVVGFVLVLGALVLGGFAGPLASGAPNNDKHKTATRIYQHTYDEVFQASLEAIERMGLFVEDKDKDKGTISGNGVYKWAGKDCTFDIHIEAINTSPETRVTINAKVKGIIPGSESKLKADFLAMLQQVLATYH